MILVLLMVGTISYAITGQHLCLDIAFVITIVLVRFHNIVLEDEIHKLINTRHNHNAENSDL